jgi:RNA polymerase sigma factor (TIGR02999 family)
VHSEPEGEVTRLLLEWSGGSETALASLLPMVYEELRAMAARHLRGERQAHTLQRTALVHEAFLRMVDQNQVDWQGRAQFFGLASQMMRRILVDHARRRLAQKRGGHAQRLSLDDLAADDRDAARAPAVDALALTDDPRVDLASIDAALKRLEAMDPQQGRLVELRFFGGLSIADTADVLGVSAATVKREWAIARAWLQRELGAGERA